MVDHPIARLVNLFFNVAQALQVPWLQVRRSAFGNWGTFGKAPPGFTSEKAAMTPATAEGRKTLARVIVGFPRQPSGPFDYPPPRSDTVVGLSQPTPQARPSERWFFINGICTDVAIAKLNAEMLAKTFDRPFTVLYNRTDGIVRDVIECTFGKAFDAVTESAKANLLALVEALCDPTVDKVVLLAHSQGTIVTAVLLKTLEEVLIEKAQVPKPKPKVRVSPERRVARRMVEEVPAGVKLAKERLLREHIGKLEVYSFANCATSMDPFVALGDPPHHAPWIESFGNEYDLVAKLGVLTPPHGVGSAHISGDRYRRKGAWGHFMNVHYLPHLLQEIRDLAGKAPELEAFSDNLRKIPRLYGYVHGRTLPSYWAPAAPHATVAAE